MPPKKSKSKSKKPKPSFKLSEKAQTELSEGQKKKKEQEEQEQKMRDEAIIPSNFPPRGPKYYYYPPTPEPLLLVTQEPSEETVLTTKLSMLHRYITGDLEEMTKKDVSGVVDDLFNMGTRTNKAFVGDLYILTDIYIFIRYCIRVGYTNVGLNNPESVTAARIVEVRQNVTIPDSFFDMVKRGFERTVFKLLNLTASVPSNPENPILIEPVPPISFGVADLAPPSTLIDDAGDEVMGLIASLNNKDEEPSANFAVVMDHFNNLVNPKRPLRDLTQETQRIITDLKESLPASEPVEVNRNPLVRNYVTGKTGGGDGFAPAVVMCAQCNRRVVDPSYASVVVEEGVPMNVQLCGADCNSKYMRVQEDNY